MQIYYVKLCEELLNATYVIKHNKSPDKLMPRLKQFNYENIKSLSTDMCKQP